MQNKEWNILKRELARTLPLLILTIAFALFNQSVFPVISMMICSFVFVALVAHIVRRTLFPYVDLQKSINKANEESLSASVVVLSFCILLSAMFIGASLMLK